MYRKDVVFPGGFKCKNAQQKFRQSITLRCRVYALKTYCFVNFFATVSHRIAIRVLRKPEITANAVSKIRAPNYILKSINDYQNIPHTNAYINAVRITSLHDAKRKYFVSKMQTTRLDYE